MARLHELACTTALLANDQDPAGICERYLAHGERLLDDDPAYDQPWAPGLSFYGRPYEWLRQSHLHVDDKGRPHRFGQVWLFHKAGLVAAAFGLWLGPSHQPVHMSSRAVAAGSEQAGAAPAGYSPEAVDQLAWQAACSFYELAAHLVLLPDPDSLSPVRRLAWTDEAHRVAVALRPGLVREPVLSPSQRRHGMAPGPHS